MTHRCHSLAPLAGLLAILITLAASAPVLAQASDAEQQLLDALQRAQELLQSGDFEGAEEAFSGLIRDTGGRVGAAYLGRAQARMEMQELAKAQEDLKNLLQYDTSGDPALSAAASNLSGEIYLAMGSLADAAAEFEAAVAADSKNPLYQFNLGKVFALGGAPDEGRKRLTKWIDAGIDDPEKNAEAHSLRAQCFAQLGKFDEANADIQKALSIDPDAYQTHALQGRVLAVQEKYEEAAAAFKTALEKYTPEEGSDLPYIEGRLQRATLLEEAAKATDDPDHGRELFQQVLDESNLLLDELPDRGEVASAKANALFNRGVAQRQLGDLAAAVRSFSDAIDINPALAPAYFRRGIAFFHLGEEQMAIADFDKAASIDFETPHAALWKGRTYAQMGEYYEAIKAYGQALSVSDRYTDAYVNRGLVYVKLGEYPRAIDDFNDAIRLQPNNAQYYYFRGVAYALQGNHKKAIASLATAIDFDEELAGAYLKMADELEAIGRPEVAGDYRARGAELSNQVSK